MKIAILGASKGLGKQLVEVLSQNSHNQLFLSSRQVEDAFGVEENNFKCDFTKEEEQLALLERLRKFDPEYVYCVAGGGPYGSFDQQKWKSHMWAFHLNFIFPARLIHFAMNELNLKGIAVVGSAIAESKADLKASSYSAAKHGILGLIKTIKLESPEFNLQLFSPTYMDTPMLPDNAAPRENGQIIADPKLVAQFCCDKLESPESSWHHILEGAEFAVQQGT